MADTARLTTALGDRYRIERELGAGGMATVYLARDTRHERDVALKVLRPDLAAILGAERFLNEVRITARLDHPHILTLIDSGESDGFLWYVLPYVRGESLRVRLIRERQLSLDQALTITRQIASALDYAHRHGVIHRDIKPENILFHEGEAMLADFGIALAVREAGGERLTETGISLGTPQYMSPEQATGERQPDARSDIYSLGAVLYEMLAGEPPVTGTTAQAMIAKLLTERPTRLRVIREGVPEGIDAAVARCLAKTPADRFATAVEFAATLERSAVEPPVRTPRRRREGILGAAGALVIVAIAYGSYRVMRGPDATLTIGRSEQLTADPGLDIEPALSPDGKLVAYAAGNSARMRIYIRPVGGGRTFPLSDDSSAVEEQPRWSPDGSHLLYLVRGGVSVAPALGGTPRPVVPASAKDSVAAAAWSPDGREIAFVRRDSLFVAALDGSRLRALGADQDLHDCEWSPHVPWIACATLNNHFTRPGRNFGNLAPSGILLFPTRGGSPVRLLEPQAFNQSPVWSADGQHLLFLSNRDGPRDIYSLALSASGRIRGAPARLTTGLGAISISISADGRRLAYAVYSARANIWSLPIPHRGTSRVADATPVTNGNQVIEAMRVSLDRRWLLFDSNLRGNSDIYRMSLGGGAVEQLTSDPADEFAPDLSPDGRELAYHSWRTGTRNIEVKPLEGGPVEQVTNSPAQESYPRWSPDGRALSFFNQQVPNSLFVTHRDLNGRWMKPTLVATPAGLNSWSPDGRTLAIVDSDVVAIMAATGGPRRRLYDRSGSVPPAEQVEWNPDGQTVYFKASDRDGRASFWEVSASGGPPRLLVQFTDPDRQSYRTDFATDGKRFYFAIQDRQSDVFVAELVAK